MRKVRMIKPSYIFSLLIICSNIWGFEEFCYQGKKFLFVCAEEDLATICQVYYDSHTSQDLEHIWVCGLGSLPKSNEAKEELAELVLKNQEFFITYGNCQPDACGLENQKIK